MITVLTPTYNRKYTLNKLFCSLANQTSMNFEWIIVDDGSTDDTKNEVNKFIAENKFTIRYIYQENGGKHRALNTGIKNIKSEITFIVDSDDYLKEDAIETIEFYHNKYKNNEKICGYSFLRCFPNDKINGKIFKKDEYISDYITCRLNQNTIGDKAEAYYTEKLKEYPFLEIEGEKFLIESYVWAQLALKYDMVHINKAIYVGNYLGDGLTESMNKRKFDCPIGFAEKSKILCNKKANLKIKCKSMILYIAYSLIANRNFKYQLNDVNYKLLLIFMYPFGMGYRKLIEKRIEKGEWCGKKAKS